MMWDCVEFVIRTITYCDSYFIRCGSPVVFGKLTTVKSDTIVSRIVIHVDVYVKEIIDWIRVHDEIEQFHRTEANIVEYDILISLCFHKHCEHDVVRSAIDKFTKSIDRKYPCDKHRFTFFDIVFVGTVLQFGNSFTINFNVNFYIF